MEKNICILDYGSGNTRSVFNVIKSISKNVVISNAEEDINNSTHLILPGVGAYSSSMDKIKEKVPLECLKNNIFLNKKPFLGICVGMQVLSTFGFEFKKSKGLNFIEGNVKKVEFDQQNLILPHVGWNSIIKNNLKNELLLDIEDGEDFYFVHSFEFIPKNLDDVLAYVDYGKKIVSIIKKDNIFGVQYQTKKSQSSGVKLLTNFINIF